MNVGDRVKTREEWNRKYYQRGVTGTVLSIQPGRGPLAPKRNHQVYLDDPINEWRRLWFDPEDLEEE